MVEHIGYYYAKIFPDLDIVGVLYPFVLADMIELWGGEVAYYPERRHCCGFGFRHYMVQANKGYSLVNTKSKFENMRPCKPDQIIASCPGCTYFPDRWQYVIAETELYL